MKSSVTNPFIYSNLLWALRLFLYLSRCKQCCGGNNTCFSSVQFSSVAQSCPTLCNPMNCSTPGLPVHHQLPEFTQTHVHRVTDTIQPSHPVVPFSSCPQSLAASESFPMSQLFAWGGQSTGVSALASFHPKKSQGWSFRMDCLDLLAVQGTLKSLLQIVFIYLYLTLHIYSFFLFFPINIFVSLCSLPYPPTGTLLYFCFPVCALVSFVLVDIIFGSLYSLSQSIVLYFCWTDLILLMGV